MHVEHASGLDSGAASSLLRAMILHGFHGRIAVASSFGTDSAVLLHLVAQIDRSTPVLMLDTGKLFDETRNYRNTLIEFLGLSDVRALRPDGIWVAAEDASGELWRNDPDACCAGRKVAPLRAALAGFDAWITGRKRHQAATRAALEVVETDSFGRSVINPLAAWSDEDLQHYRERHNLPEHPLLARGYASIGCAPCTHAVLPGENKRAGRWAGLAKTECGIHSRAPAPATSPAWSVS